MNARRLPAILLQVVAAGSGAFESGCGHGSCDGYVAPPPWVQVVTPDAAAITEPVGTALSIERCAAFCNDVLSCRVIGVDGGRAIECTQAPARCDGRRPAGLQPSNVSVGATVIARFLAEAAHLEAASVVAFRILARELRGWGAPQRLLHAARRAARDEVRHARVMRSLARRRGGRAPEAVVDSPRARSLEEMSLENTLEGCVRETWGALVATWQGQRARDPAIRGALARIARDETRHAALAWEVESWLRRRLPPEARRRVECARRRAFDELKAEILRTSEDASLVDLAGVPSRAASVRLLDLLRERTAA